MKKPPALVQFDLGETPHHNPTTRAIQSRGIQSVCLRTSPECGETPSHDLTLSLPSRDTKDVVAAINRLGERYQIVGIIPPHGTSLAAIQLGDIVAHIAEQHQLPGISTLAHALSSNRFLCHCHLQSTLPTQAFALIQHPSSLTQSANSLGVPVRLSPVHYALPHLESRINTLTSLAEAYAHIQRNLSRWMFAQGRMPTGVGVDPRTLNVIRFNWGSDQLMCHDTEGTEVAVSVMAVRGEAHGVACQQVIRRDKDPVKITLRQTHMIRQLAEDAVTVLGVQTAWVHCILHHTPKKTTIEGVIPHYVDPRMIDVIEKTTKTSWEELMVGLYALPASGRSLKIPRKLASSKGC